MAGTGGGGGGSSSSSSSSKQQSVDFGLLLTICAAFADIITLFPL